MNAPPPARLRYPLREAASLLGMSERLLRMRIAEGAVAVVRDGRRVYVHRDEVERYARDGSLL